MTLGSLAYFLASKLQTLASYHQPPSLIRTPEQTHILITRSTLTHDPSIPSRIIMEIEHGVSTGFKDALNEDIVFTQESCVEGGGSLIVSYHVLPSEWESEAVMYQSPSYSISNVEGRRER
jgi:hypothetical protein